MGTGEENLGVSSGPSHQLVGFLEFCLRVLMFYSTTKAMVGESFQSRKHLVPNLFLTRGDQSGRFEAILELFWSSL
jgi:hypothetical protein